ncbi:MAG: triose-phosphate isomerase [Desulfobulbaceae bacterium]|nr:triose-phosphate isomerase [Desulfobulbaceae bacterium]
MSRKPLIAGNWKMYCTVSEAVALAIAVAKSSRGLTDREVMIAPPFTALSAVVDAVKDSPVLVGAQNIAWEKQGAYTGEISPPMLNDLGVAMAIVGHSERRHIFLEDNEMISQRLTGALAGGVIPVLCVGETLDEREDGATFNVLENQIRAALEGVATHQLGQLVVAYEPVWAIGTGKTATTAQAQEAHSFIRGLLAGLYEKNLAGQIRILYGGSVKPENVDSLMAQPDIDGALVGGAALNSESFDRIIHFS